MSQVTEFPHKPKEPEVRPPDTCHHWQTVHTECGHYVAQCGICEMVLPGNGIWFLPDCAQHWHNKNEL